MARDKPFAPLEYRCHMPKRSDRNGVALITSGYRSIDIAFGDPQFDTCVACGQRVARLGERERWHHIDRSIGHEPNVLLTPEITGFSTWMTGRPWWKLVDTEAGIVQTEGAYA